MILLKQMTVLLAVMFLGYFMAGKKVLNEDVCRSISWIIVNIANPALIMSGCLDLQEAVGAKDIVYTFVTACIMFAVLIVAAWILPLIFRFKPVEKGAYKVMLVFSNFGFMGFPIINAMYGTKGILYASVFLIPFDILIYTYGVVVIGEKTKKLPLKNILNIGVIACVLLLVCVLTKTQLPDTAGNFIEMLSNITAPLSMMVIGASMLDLSFKRLFKNYKLLLFSVVRMIVIPVIGGMLIKHLITGDVLQGVSLILLAAPVASMSAMLAQQYNGEYELASQGVALSTIMSVITMPMVFWIVGI